LGVFVLFDSTSGDIIPVQQTYNANRVQPGVTGYNRV